jgi:hypothetical protein
LVVVVVFVRAVTVRWRVENAKAFAY